jgi:hypothetical protein
MWGSLASKNGIISFGLVMATTFDTLDWRKRTNNG